MWPWIWVVVAMDVAVEVDVEVDLGFCGDECGHGHGCGRGDGCELTWLDATRPQMNVVVKNIRTENGQGGTTSEDSPA